MSLPRPTFPATISTRRDTPKPESSTYAIWRQGFVKIGRSRQIEVRLRHFEVSPKPGVIVPPGLDWSAPLSVLTTFPFDDEENLHQKWAHLRVAGEWFVGRHELLYDLMYLDRCFHGKEGSPHGDPLWRAWFSIEARLAAVSA